MELKVKVEDNNIRHKMKEKNFNIKIMMRHEETTVPVLYIVQSFGRFKH